MRKVQHAIELWNWSSPHSSHNSGEQSQELYSALSSLVDLAPKLRGKATEEAHMEHLQSLMRQACDMKRRKSEGDQYTTGWWIMASISISTRYSVTIIQHDLLTCTCTTTPAADILTK